MTEKKTCRFLIVGDADQNLLFFEMLLRDMGYTDVTTARTGADGLQIVEENRADFAIVAWELSSMSGTVFVQKVRSVRKRRFMPFMIYSKRMAAEDTKLLADIGIENVLSMPFDKEKAKAFIGGIVAAWQKPDPIQKVAFEIDEHIANANYNDALRLIVPKVLVPGPHTHLVHTGHGEVWLKLSQYDKSEAALAQALALKPDHPQALRLMAKLKSLKGQHQEAIAILEQLSNASPKNLTNLLHLGSAYVKADKHDKARQVLDKVGAIDPESRPLKDELGQLAFKEGNMSLAAQLLSETDSGDEIAAYFNNLAITFVNRGDIPKGIETYSNAMKVLATKAKLYILHYNMGLAQRKSNDLAAALRSFCNSYDMEPTFEKAYASYVKLFKELKEKNQCAETLKETAPKVKAARQRFEIMKLAKEPPAA
jgi:tetratricopeptide (TPR) repeat protein